MLPPALGICAIPVLPRITTDWAVEYGLHWKRRGHPEQHQTVQDLNMLSSAKNWQNQ
jgi:hypothetical protein